MASLNRVPCLPPSITPSVDSPLAPTYVSVRNLLTLGQVGRTGGEKDDF